MQRSKIIADNQQFNVLQQVVDMLLPQLYDVSGIPAAMGDSCFIGTEPLHS